MMVVEVLLVVVRRLAPLGREAVRGLERGRQEERRGRQRGLRQQRTRILVGRDGPASRRGSRRGPLEGSRTGGRVGSGAGEGASSRSVL